MKRFVYVKLIKVLVLITLVAAYSLSPYVVKSKEEESQVKAVFDTNQGRKASVDEEINDPLLDSEKYILATESSSVWQLIEQKREVRVAVVDTGVDYNHPDLKNKVLKNLGYDFYNNDNDPMDDGWHGTHVAGIIAAEANNGVGITGVTGNLDVKIIPIKVMSGDGKGPSNIVAQGIKYAVDKKADIINLSIDFDVKDKYIEEAIKYAWDKGVFVVVSAGNNNSNCDYSSPTSDFGAYTVAAVNSFNERTSFSAFGNSVKVSAPGEKILSTVPGGIFAYRDGTSMAAPIVTGIAAMLKAHNPNITPAELTEILTESTVPFNELDIDKPIGSGVVNAKNAFSAMQSSILAKQ